MTAKLGLGLKEKKVGCFALWQCEMCTYWVSPAGKEDLSKPVVTKKKEISTTCEALAAPAYHTCKRKKLC